jgi:hypothetical protein
MFGSMCKCVVQRVVHGEKSGSAHGNEGSLLHWVWEGEAIEGGVMASARTGIFVDDSLACVSHCNMLSSAS